MNLENSVKFHAAKTQRFTDEPPATRTDALTGTDVLAAMGMAQAEAGFGMAAFFGKMDISQDDKRKAINELMQFASKRIGKYKTLAKLEGRKKGRVLMMISAFAYNDYCTTAATPGARCKYCKGRGVVLDVDKTQETGERVVKPCKRCNGQGYKKEPASKLFRAIKLMVPDLSQPTFSRNIKPLIDELIAQCYIEESRAEKAIQKTTR